MSSAEQLVKQRALALLARREHSRLELRRKLVARGFESSLVEQTIAELAAENYQSEQRFVENYTRQRTEAGFGPRRIAYELQERGITQLPLLLQTETTPYWQEKLEALWHKKNKQSAQLTDQQRAKWQRFLLNRGFAPQQVNQWLKRLL